MSIEGQLIIVFGLVLNTLVGPIVSQTLLDGASKTERVLRAPFVIPIFLMVLPIYFVIKYLLKVKS